MPRAGLSTASVIAAAADLADEAGPDAVTPSEVARRVGVRTPSLYAHVGGAEALLRGVTLLALAEMADVVGEAVSGRSGRDALRALADAYRDYAAAHPGRYTLSRRPLDADAAAGSAGPRHTALVRAVLRGYGVADDEHVHAVRLVGSTVHGFVSLEAAESFAHSDPTADVSWSRVVDALDVALGAWPAGADRGSSSAQ